MIRRASAATELTAQSRSGLIVLRHPRWADYDDWAELRRGSEDWLRPWEPEWSDAHLSRGSYRLRLNRFKKMVAADSAYLFHIFRADTEALLGACHLTHIERSAAQSAKLGYWIGQRHANRGSGLAAINSVSRFGFETLGLHRIEAAVQAVNHPSIRVLEKACYRLEGTARGYLKIGGRWTDHLVYARLSSD